MKNDTLQQKPNYADWLKTAQAMIMLILTVMGIVVAIATQGVRQENKDADQYRLIAEMREDQLEARAERARDSETIQLILRNVIRIGVKGDVENIENPK